LLPPVPNCANDQLPQATPRASIFALSEVPNGGYGSVVKVLPLSTHSIADNIRHLYPSLVMLERAVAGDLIGSYAGESFGTETDSWDSNGYGAWKSCVLSPCCRSSPNTAHTRSFRSAWAERTRIVSRRGSSCALPHIPARLEPDIPLFRSRRATGSNSTRSTVSILKRSET
jgi:hypothetical protein